MATGFTSSEPSRPRSFVFELHLLKKLQEGCVKPALGFDLQVASLPIHQLDIAEFALTQLKVILQ
jgi:hypothetical protein